MIIFKIIAYFVVLIAIGFFLVWYNKGSYEIEDSEGYSLGVQYLPEDGELKVALLLTVIVFKF